MNLSEGGALASAPQFYEFGDFRLDALKRLLLDRSGGTVPLAPKVFDTLLYLVQHSGLMLEKERLIKAVWPDSIVEENNLNQNISTLRRVLGESPGSHRYIVTVPGYGYRFVAEVLTTPTRSHITPVAPFRSIAVLPFKPLVAKARDATLEMGMADTLIAKLGSIRDVIVRPLSSVRKYVGLEEEPLAVGRELGVDSVLDGSLQRHGDNIRVTVRLMNVSNGESLWAGTFNEKFTGIFAVQDAISEKVTEALALRLSSEEKVRLTKRYTDNTEAYQLYLKGRYFWWKTTPEGFRKSVEYYQRAVEVDPTYALGYCGISSYWGFGSAWGMLRAEQGWPKAVAANAKALQLDDTLVEVHNDLGGINMVYHRNWLVAEREMKRAIELSPTFEEVHYLYSFFLIVMGRMEEALAESKRALELDPFSLRLNQHLGQTYYFARQYNEAITQYQQALELDPHNAATHKSLGDVLERKELKAEAVKEWQTAMELSGDHKLGVSLGSVYAKEGFASASRAMMRKKLDRLNARMKAGDPVLGIDYARAYLRLGDTEQALHWLSIAAEERNVFALLIKSDPFYDGLRDQPRFATILKRIGLR